MLLVWAEAGVAAVAGPDAAVVVVNAGQLDEPAASPGASGRQQRVGEGPPKGECTHST